MKTGRNEPCPCGSGKKYKKCCLQDDKSSNLLASARETANETMLESLQHLMFNVRKRTLGRKPHIKEYTAMRKMHGEIVDAMVAYYDAGKFKPRFDKPDRYKKSKKPIEVKLLNSSFDLETKVGAHAFYDRMIYKVSPNASCITEDFSNRYRKPEKVAMLQSMLDSKLGLFEITTTDPDEGYVNLREIFTGEEIKIIDIGLSGNKGFEAYIYTRVITYQDISFGTGLNLVFNKTDPFIQAFIKRHTKDYKPFGEYERFTELYNRFSVNQNGIRLATNTY